MAGASAAARKGPLRILLVDDDMEIIDLVKLAFAGEGCRVMSASDGGIALTIMEYEQFDAVITDLKMAQMGGVELLTAAIADERNKDTKFFILSGNITNEAQAAVSGLGVARIVEKPFDVAALVRTVVDAVRPPRRNVDVYDAKVIMSVTESIRQVMTAFLKNNVVIGDPYIKSDEASPSYVTAFLPLSQGRTCGQLTIICNQFFVGLLGRSALGVDKAKMSLALAIDLVGEVLAQIGGQMRTNLATQGHNWVVGLPQVVVGEGHKVIHHGQGPLLAVPVRSSMFPTYIEIYVTETIIKAKPVAQPQ